jgi:hypothetical protein
MILILQPINRVANLQQVGMLVIIELVQVKMRYVYAYYQ